MKLIIELDISDAIVLRSEIDQVLGQVTSQIAVLRDARNHPVTNATQTLPEPGADAQHPGATERELLRRRSVLSKIQREL